LKKNVLFGIGLLIAIVMNVPSVIGSGKEWRLSFSPVTEDLFDVFMINADDGWIVGGGEMILHWNGSHWTQVPCPAGADLRGVSMRTSDDGWAVGLNGVTIHWNGTDWTDVASGTSVHLLDVAATDSDYYYAVGADGTIIRWNGTDWEEISSIPTSESLRAIDLERFALMPPFYFTWGWAVGDSGTTLYRNDSGWFEKPCPSSEQLNDVCMIEVLGHGNHSDVWAVGSSWETIHWNGTAWTIHSNPKTGEYGYLTTIDMVNGSIGWAMGYDGVILHWLGSEWMEWSSPTTNVLYALDMIGTHDGWAVGAAGTIIRWTGTEWIPESYGYLPLLLLVGTLLLAIVRHSKFRRWIPNSAARG
jgi:hypothetical protein